MKLAVPSDAPQDVRSVVTVANNNPGAIAITSDGRMAIHLDRLRPACDETPYSSDELRDAVEVLRMLEGARIRVIGSKIGTFATWYEYVVLGTYQSNWNTYENFPGQRYWYPNPGLAFSTVSETLRVYLSGTLLIPLARFQLEVGVSFTWTSSAGLATWIDPPAPPSDYWSYGYPRIVRHYHRWSTLYEQYWCTNEDIPGQVTKYYCGSYWSYATQHEWTTGVPVYQLTDVDPGL
jgi:hypothetical protein